MAINTFFTPGAVSPAALAAAMGQPMDIRPPAAGGGQPGAPTFDQAALAAPATQPGAPGSPMLHDQPTRSNFAQGLIDYGMNPNRPVQSGFEGVGRIAALASGYYHKSKDDDLLRKREESTAEYLKRVAPEYAEMYQLGDKEERSKIIAAARADLAQRAATQRQRDMAMKDYDAVKKQALSDKELDPFVRAQIESGNPQIVAAGLDAYHKERQARATASRQLQAKQYEQDTKRKNLEAAGYTPAEIAAAMAGQSPEYAPNARVGGFPYPNLDDLSRGKIDHSANVTAERKAHGDVVKEMRADLQTLAGQKARLMEVRNAIDTGAYTGAFAETYAAAAKLADVFGVKVKGLSEQQVILAVQNELAKGAREGYAGAVSNFEYQRYLGSVPGLLQTKEGNIAVMDMMKRMIDLRMTKTQFAQEYRKMRMEAGLQPVFGSGFVAYMADRYAQLDAETNAAYDKLREQALSKQKADAEAKVGVGFLKPGSAGPAGAPAAPTTGGGSVVTFGGKSYEYKGQGPDGKPIYVPAQ